MKIALIIIFFLLGFSGMAQSDTVFTQKNGIVLGEFLSIDEKYVYLRRDMRPAENYYLIRKKKVTSIHLANGKIIKPNINHKVAASDLNVKKEVGTKNEEPERPKEATAPSNSKQTQNGTDLIDLKKVESSDSLFEFPFDVFARITPIVYSEKGQYVPMISVGVRKPINDWLWIEGGVTGTIASGYQYQEITATSVLGEHGNRFNAEAHYYQEGYHNNYNDFAFFRSRFHLSIVPRRQINEHWSLGLKAGFIGGNAAYNSGDLYLIYDGTTMIDQKSHDVYQMDLQRFYRFGLMGGTTLGASLEYHRQNWSLEAGLEIDNFIYRTQGIDLFVEGQSYRGPSYFDKTTRLQIPITFHWRF